MDIARVFAISSRRTADAPTCHWRPCIKFWRTLALPLFILIAYGSAKAQFVGYAWNPNTGSVDVLGISTNDPAHGFQDFVLGTATGVTTTKTGFSSSPIAVRSNPNSAYVVNPSANSLSVIVPNFSTNTFVSTPLNLGSTCPLSTPSAIAIATVSTSKIYAYVANSGNNTVCVIDTSTNKAVGGPISLTFNNSSFSASTQMNITVSGDGTEVWLTALSVTVGGQSVNGVWSIDTSSNTTAVQRSGSNGLNPQLPSAIASTSVIDAQGTSHTYIFIADTETTGTGISISHTGEIYYLDQSKNGPGGTWSSPYVIATNAVGQAPEALAAFVPVVPGSGQIAQLYIGDGAQSVWEVSLDCSGSGGYFANGCAALGQIESSLHASVPGPVSSITVTPDGAFVYATLTVLSPSTQPALEVLDANTLINKTASSVASTTIGSSQPDGLFGIATVELDRGSPPACWFLGTIPAVLALKPSTSITGLCIANRRDALHISALDFGSFNGQESTCKGQGNPNSAPGPCFDTPSEGGSDSLGGIPVFPVSGGFQLTLTGSVGSATGQAQQQVSAGANCTFDHKSIVIVNQPLVGTTLTCTAPAVDSITGTVLWGSPSANSGDNNLTPVKSTGTNTTELDFPTHTYASPGMFPISASATDVTENALANIVLKSGDSATVLVTSGLACALSATPTTVAIGGTVTATLGSCVAPPNDVLSGTVNWGDGKTSAVGPSTADSSGNVPAFSATHTYSAATTETISASITDSSGNIVVLNPTSVQINITTTLNFSAPQPPGSGTSFIVAPGQTITEPLVFSGGPAGASFTVNPCSVTPATSNGPKCSAPSSFTLDANGTATVPVTITTSGPETSSLFPTGGSWRTTAFAFLLPIGMGIICLGWNLTNRTRKAWGLALLLTAVVILLSAGACSSVHQSDFSCPSCTASGSYTTTVTARSVSTNPQLSAQGGFTLVIAQ